ncbi:MAG: CoA-binding protein [Syntrophomonadaceae bacterium]
MLDFFTRFNKLAILGVSSDPKSFSRQAYAFLRAQGYELYPVNPHLDSIEGQPCYKSLELVPPVQAAVFFTRPRVTEQLLPICKAQGIQDVWFQQGSADKAVHKAATELGIKFNDSCVFLHHAKAGFPHNVHRFIVRALGKDLS